MVQSFPDAPQPHPLDTAELESWLQSGSVDRIADYVARARRYSGIPDDELLKRWKDALRLTATDPAAPEHGVQWRLFRF